MKRRIFNVLAAISLALCLATAGLWVWSYTPLFHSSDDNGWLGTGSIAIGELTSVSPSGEWHLLGFHCTWDRSLGMRALVVPMRLLFAVTAILPALWLWRWHRHRRATDGGMPHCPKCHHNLTGNVSGICTECRTAAERQAKQEEIDRGELRG